MAKPNSKKGSRGVAEQRREAERTITQPSARTFTTWTPAQVKSALQSADTGNMMRLADLCDQLIGDDRLCELLETLIGAVLGAELTFEKDSHVTRGKRPATKLDDDWWDAYPEDELMQFVMWGELCGFAWGQNKWLENEHGRLVPHLEFWHPRNFRYDWTERTWRVRDASGNEEAIAPGDGKWVLYTRRGDFRPWANGLWRGASLWWLLKLLAVGDWGQHGEKASRLVVTSAIETANAGGSGRGTNPGAGVGGKDQRKQLALDIYDAARDAVIVMPTGFDMKLIEATANTRQIYEAQINAANEAFSISVLGQNLTSKVEGGSLAAAETHERVEARKVIYVARRLSLTLRKQALTWWALYNFGDARKAPWPKWHVEPPEDVGKKAKTLSDLGNALLALKNAGFAPDPAYIEEEFGVPLTKIATPEAGDPEQLDGNPTQQPAPPKKKPKT